MMEEITMVLAGLLICFIIACVCGLLEAYFDPMYGFSEDCYYCKYSTKPMRLRDRSKNTCKRINNKGWTSEQIRNCPYREINR